MFFFFSSRRRHTRFDCDWSSDVCSSDLVAPPPGGGLTVEQQAPAGGALRRGQRVERCRAARHPGLLRERSEEHTSELQSQSNLVCRLLLEKKKTQYYPNVYSAVSGL